MTYEWWSTLIFCQELAEAVEKSDNLRLPTDAGKTLEDLKAWHEAKEQEDEH